MTPQALLLPVCVLALYTLLLYPVMGIRRVRAVRDGRVDVRYYRTYDQGTEPADLRQVSRNISNLFESPVLFYSGVIIAVLTQHTGWLLVTLAWVYVIIRIIHSLVHITINRVNIRLNIFLASLIVLLIYWVILTALIAGSLLG